MLNKVIDSIAQKLNQVFGAGYEIYVDEMEQELIEPYFLIVCLSGRQEREIGTTYKWELPFDIRYFPQVTALTRELNSVVDTLNIGLEYIQIEGGLLRGTQLKHEVIDGVLHFFVNYDLRFRRVAESDEFMGNLKWIERVKGYGS